MNHLIINMALIYRASLFIYIYVHSFSRKQQHYPKWQNTSPSVNSCTTVTLKACGPFSSVHLYICEAPGRLFKVYSLIHDVGVITTLLHPLISISLSLSLSLSLCLFLSLCPFISLLHSVRWSITHTNASLRWAEGLLTAGGCPACFVGLCLNSKWEMENNEKTLDSGSG